MNVNAAQGALANYQATGAQTAMENASPHRLIDMLNEARVSAANPRAWRAQWTQQSKAIVRPDGIGPVPFSKQAVKAVV